MKLGKIVSSGSSVGNVLASLISASAGACAGGVCVVGAQAGAGLFTAASSSSFAAMVATAGAAGVPTPVVHQGLPWWMKLAVVALMLSTTYTTATLAHRPFWAVLAALGGTVAVVAELRWLPVGSFGQILVIAFGLIPLVLGPFLARSTAPLPHPLYLALLGSVAGIAALSLAVALWLQFAREWEPCVLCYIERVSLVVIFFAILARLPWVALLAILSGFLASLYQVYETVLAAQDTTGFCSLFSHVSCAVAGSRVFGPWPIAVDSGAVFTLLFALALPMLKGAADKRPRSVSHTIAERS
jgi:hypothetical protein